MNDTDIIGLTSGLLQFGVACYALRLGRLFKSTLMGWLLFSALSLLALVYLLLAVKPFGVGAQLGIKVDIIYFLISLLLLLGMVRLYSNLKNFLREEGAERRALDEWESQVKERWAELTKANEELRQTANRLEEEIVEQKQAREQAEKASQDQLTALRQSEESLRQTVAELQTEIARQTEIAKQAEIAKPNGPQEPQNSPPEQAEQTDQQRLTTAGKNGEESQPAVLEPGTEIIGLKETRDQIGKTDQQRLTASRKNCVESWETAVVPNTRIAERKRRPRTHRKKFAKARR